MTGIIVLALLAGAIGAALGGLAKWLQTDSNDVIERIDRLLPQTQCAQCGYPGCRPYATAIAAGDANINQCPPGGQITITALADLLGVNAMEPDTSYGIEKPPLVAVIREHECIGCTLCLQACPVDAIVGAAKYMHTVISDHCTGCELCLPPCPIDCIDLIETGSKHG